jgi:hypothetical protein
MKTKQGPGVTVKSHDADIIAPTVRSFSTFNDLFQKIVKTGLMITASFVVLPLSGIVLYFF